VTRGFEVLVSMVVSHPQFSGRLFYGEL